MLVQKFARQPKEVTSLDGSDKVDDVQKLAELDGAANIPAVDFGLAKNGNPDGVSGMGKLRPVPGVMTKPR